MNFSSQPTITNLFQAWAQKRPKHRLFAFVDEHGNKIEDYSYAEFCQRVDTIAARIMTLDDLSVGDRVLLAFQPGLELIAALFACAKIGLVAVPTPPIGPFDFAAWAHRIDHILEDCKPELCLTCTRTLELLEEGQHRQFEDDLQNFSEKLRSILTLDTQSVPTAPNANVVERSHPITFIQYTSGSTSQPKGVCVTHENLITNCRAIVDHDNPVAVTWLPQHHDMGLIGYYIYIALSGGTTWGMAPRTFVQNPLRWLEQLSRHRATATSVPNFALDLCLNERRVPSASLAKLDLSGLRFLMVAAEPVAPETFEAFRRKFTQAGLKQSCMFAAYGLAESTLAVTSYGRHALSVDRRHLALGKVSPITDAREVSHAMPLMSCGRALADIDLRIVDPNTRIEVDPGQSGEVWVAGPSRAAGYWQKPELDEHTFNANLVGAPNVSSLFLRTGDIGFLHDGELFICGRLKDMIIVHGQNIYPEDIEALALKAEPNFRRNGIAAFSSGDGPETSITIVAEIARSKPRPCEANIVRVIREGLQVPVARVVLVPPRSIARTSSGKTRRAETRKRLESGTLEILRDTQHKLFGQGTNQDPDIYELELLKSRYGITGEEDATLFDVGIDSLDVVVFLNWIKDSLIERDAALLAERVNPKLLSAISIRELFAIARLFDVAPHEAKMQMANFFERNYALQLRSEHQKMATDRIYTHKRCHMVQAGPERLGIFVTGATGFLGPFLVDALLAQSDGLLHVLVRGNSHKDAEARLRTSFFEAIDDPKQRAAFEARVNVVRGNLEAPKMGLDQAQWHRLARGIGTVYHNGALVNYVLPYAKMRQANVQGTERVLDMCFDGCETVLNYISTTFVFGWATKEQLFETDRNDLMDKLDFGYSQSKWVAEQKVLSAMDQGLSARVFRPALITPALAGLGGNLDISIRLLSFMIKHGLGVTAGNQVSFMPADVCANNIVAIARQNHTVGGSFHVVRDEVETMEMITDIIARKTGVHFEMFELSDFVREVIRRCTRADPLYPLLDFLIDSTDNISAMQYKRYNSEAYQISRDRSQAGRSDPPLEAVVDGILYFLRSRKLL